MQTVSSRWEGAVRGGVAIATVLARVDIYSYYGDLLASTERAISPYPKLELDSGSVTVDSSASIRRSARLTFRDNSGVFAPDSGVALLANESGNEVRIYAGFRYGDGTTELLPQGVFGFADDDTESGLGDQTVSLTVFDRSRRIRRAKFIAPYLIAAGTNYVSAIEAMLRSRWVDIRINSVPTIFTTPKLTFDEQDDPWDKATDMASKIGYELFFDVEGVCQLRPVTRVAPTTPVAFEYAEGSQATILSVSRRASNEQRPNGVIVVGQSSSNVGKPPRGEAWDTDPGSPTYSGFDPSSRTFGPSPYGAVPTFITSSLVTTVSQATAAAQAELLKVVGRHETIEFTAIPNVAHEPGDLVRVVRSRAKIDALYELQSFNVPLRVGESMTALTKERRVA